jgi:hypothetical protein
MKKENVALYEAHLPFRKIAPKNVSKFIQRMEPMSEDMRVFLYAYFSAPNEEAQLKIKNDKLATMTVEQQQVFHKAFLQCLKHELNTFLLT